MGQGARACSWGREGGRASEGSCKQCQGKRKGERATGCWGKCRGSACKGISTAPVRAAAAAATALLAMSAPPQPPLSASLPATGTLHAKGPSDAGDGAGLPKDRSRWAAEPARAHGAARRSIALPPTAPAPKRHLGAPEQPRVGPGARSQTKISRIQAGATRPRLGPPYRDVAHHTAARGPQGAARGRERPGAPRRMDEQQQRGAV